MPCNAHYRLYMDLQAVNARRRRFKIGITVAQRNVQLCGEPFSPQRASPSATTPSRLRKKGFRGDVRAAGMTAMSLSDALAGRLTAYGGPGACDVRSGLAAPAYVASIAWGAGVSAVISLAIRTRL